MSKTKEWVVYQESKLIEQYRLQQEKAHEDNGQATKEGRRGQAPGRVKAEDAWHPRVAPPSEYHLRDQSSEWW